MTLHAFGDGALLLELEQRVDDAIVEHARALADAWEALGLGEAIPAYASVVLRFDPARTPRTAALAAAEQLVRDPRPSATVPVGRLVSIPTVYDGPDLTTAAERSGISEGELVDRHAARDYRAYFLGFMPGLAYCGPLDPRIDVPRLEIPRQRVPAGSVAIAGGQTVVYPFDSPGGWSLIGRTDVTLFDAQRDPPALIRAGDRVRFVPR